MINQKMYQNGATPSKIRELFEYGKQRKLEIGDENVFDFTLGNPSVPSPKIVNETLIKLLEKPNVHCYTSAQGDIEVRRAIKDYINQKYHTNHNENLIYLTVGAAAGLVITLNAILNEDDEVIVFAPFFPEYRVFTNQAKGILKVVNPLETSFEPDLDDFIKNINEKTKAIIINLPNNPTGVIYSNETLKKISQILLNKSKEFNHPIYLISDEPYRELVYENKDIPYITNYYPNTIVCYSFSKSLSLPGERIGYLLVSEKAQNAKELYLSICGSGRSLGYVCAPSLFQYMIKECIGQTSDLIVYQQNRDLLYNTLKSLGYDVVYPSGAFYLFVKALESDANKFCEVAKKFELLLVPSDSFGYPGYVRIAYCVSTTQVYNSLKAFERLKNEYR